MTNKRKRDRCVAVWLTEGELAKLDRLARETERDRSKVLRSLLARAKVGRADLVLENTEREE